MTEALIIRDDSRLQITFTPQAMQRKETALSEAALIGRVTDADEQKLAVSAQAGLRAMIKDVESARKLCKEPVIEFGRAIDGAAKKFVVELAEEEVRLATLVGNFQELELARVRAAEAAKRLEEERIEKERQEAIRRVEEEKRREMQAAQAAEREAQRKLDEARNAKERALAEEAKREAERQASIVTAQTLDQIDAINEAFSRKSLEIAPVIHQKAEGQVVTTDWEITVSDVHALYRAHPLCCKVTPLLSEIRNLLDAGIKVAGVKAEKVVKSTTRANAGKTTLVIG